MTVAAARAGGASSRTQLLYDSRFRSIFIQVLVLAAVVLAAYWVVRNTVENLRRANIASGFGFFDARAGFDIGQSLISFTSTDTIARAFVVGVLNTLIVAVLGIIVATVVGLLIGLARLSPRDGSPYWFGAGDGFPAQGVTTMAPAGPGEFWLGVSAALCLWKPGRAPECRPCAMVDPGDRTARTRIARSRLSRDCATDLGAR